MGIAAVAEDLAGRDELEELFRLDASESDPEDDEDDVDEDEDEDDEEDDEDGKGVRPEGMPHD
jgi:hypothetical protein